MAENNVNPADNNSGGVTISNEKLLEAIFQVSAETNRKLEQSSAETNLKLEQRSAAIKAEIGSKFKIFDSKFDTKLEQGSRDLKEYIAINTSRVVGEASTKIRSMLVETQNHLTNAENILVRDFPSIIEQQNQSLVVNEKVIKIGERCNDLYECIDICTVFEVNFGGTCEIIEDLSNEQALQAEKQSPINISIEVLCESDKHLDDVGVVNSGSVWWPVESAVTVLEKVDVYAKDEGVMDHVSHVSFSENTARDADSCIENVLVCKQCISRNMTSPSLIVLHMPYHNTYSAKGYTNMNSSENSLNVFDMPSHSNEALIPVKSTAMCLRPVIGQENLKMFHEMSTVYSVKNTNVIHILRVYCILAVLRVRTNYCSKHELDVYVPHQSVHLEEISRPNPHFNESKTVMYTCSKSSKSSLVEIDNDFEINTPCLSLMEVPVRTMAGKYVENVTRTPNEIQFTEVCTGKSLENLVSTIKTKSTEVSIGNVFENLMCTFKENKSTEVSTVNSFENLMGTFKENKSTEVSSVSIIHYRSEVPNCIQTTVACMSEISIVELSKICAETYTGIPIVALFEIRGEHHARYLLKLVNIKKYGTEYVLLYVILLETQTESQVKVNNVTEDLCMIGGGYFVKEAVYLADALLFFIYNFKT